MDISLLADGKLLLIIALAGLVSLFMTMNVAARPAAVKTGQVATAFTVAQLLFMITRFSNLFYAPLFGSFVDQAVRNQRVDILYGQMQWVIFGSAAGTLVSWVLLSSAVELYCRGVRCIQHRGSMLKALFRLLRPAAWKVLLQGLRRPSNFGVGLGQLEGVPAGFLWANVLATAVWTVGVLAALYVSGAHPEYTATAILLSGLVNSVAAIAFSVWVDPKAALITDQAKAGEVPARHVDIVAVHLSAGNVLGAVLGLACLSPAIEVITVASAALGSQGGALVNSLGVMIFLNLIFALLASTTYSSRISAVLTGRVATAIAIYNLFFLVTRLAGQIYGPALGAIRDHVVTSHQLELSDLFTIFQWVLLGAAAGAVIGFVAMPTFVQVYIKAIHHTDRLGSVASALGAALNPKNWGAVLACLRAPSLFGITWKDIKALPKGFLIGNVVVMSIHTVGMIAAIYAGAQLSDDLARTATLLSSLVNGVATIMLSVVVDPMTARITDQAVEGERPISQVYAMGVCLMFTMMVGTLVAPLLLEPASWVIVGGARLLDLII